MNAIQTVENSFLDSPTVFEKVGPTYSKCFSSTRACAWGDIVPLIPDEGYLHSFPQSESWITEKLQTASDESYKDPANLESKLQKHQAFEAEITAHEEAIDAVRETGEELITSGHFAAEEVERRIEALYLHWEELLEASANKGRRLEEARDHQKFNQEVDIADSCISEKVCPFFPLLLYKTVGNVQSRQIH